MLTFINTSLTAQDYTAICSAFIALCALFATIWQSRATIHHNKISVRPHLIWHTSRNNLPGKCVVTFSIKNHGLGPAIIRNRFFTLNGERYRPNVAMNEVEEFINHAFGKRINLTVLRYGLPGGDASMLQGGDFVIAEISFNDIPSDKLWSLEHIVGNIDFIANYESLYGEKFKLQASKDKQEDQPIE
jgi:hypothetical protein